MRILYIDLSSNPNSMGGAQKSLLNIMTEMKKRGNEAILAIPKDGLLVSKAQNEGIRTLRFALPATINTRIRFGQKRYFNIFAAIYDVFILLLSGFSLFVLTNRIKPDIVHANQMLVSIAAGIASKLAKVPCIWHIRENPAAHISKTVIKIFGVFGFLLSDQVIVNSKFTADIFRNTSLLNKIVVVPIGVENTTDNLIQNDSRSTNVISIIGRIIPMKGHEILIKSLNIINQKHVDFELQIVGYFNPIDPYYLSLVSLIEEFELTSKVKFCGFKSSISPILNSSDIIVSSSTESESFGRTIIEAMAARKPVVASRIGAHPEIIEDGITGFLVEPGNPEQLADRIELLLMNKKFAMEMGQHGRERYEKCYTLDQYCKDIEDTYRRLIN